MESREKKHADKVDSIVEDRINYYGLMSLSKPPVTPKTKMRPKSPLFWLERGETPSTTSLKFPKAEPWKNSSSSMFSFSSPAHSEDELPHYPASCTHTARLPIVTDSDSVTKSMSVQDLPSLSKERTKKASTLQKKDSSKSLNSQKKFWTLKRGSVSKFTTSERSSPEMFDGSSNYDCRSIAGSDQFDLTESTESFYKSFEDVAYDESSSISLDYGSPLHNTCTQTTLRYTGDVWREVGDQGSVIQLLTGDVSLHIHQRAQPQTEGCESCARLTKPEHQTARKYSTSVLQTQRRLDVQQPISKRRFGSSKPLKYSHSEASVMLTDYDCPTLNNSVIDGRLVCGLEDPPDAMFLSNNLEKLTTNNSLAHKVSQTFVLAGPAIRLDLKDTRTISDGAILQVQTNTILNDYKADAERQQCVFACLQSTSYKGPYRELKSCRQFGESLQVSLDATQLPSSIKDKISCQIHLIPVVKQVEQAFSLTSPWEGVSQKTFYIGIYGPRHTYNRSTCCVSMSSTGFCPATLKVQHDKHKYLSLRLLNSFHLVVHNIQGYKLFIRPSSSSSLELETNLSDCFFSEDEMRTKSRVNKTFVLKHSSPNSLGIRSPSTESSNRKFTVELKGLTDQRTFRMRCTAAKLKIVDYPKTLSPVVATRLAETEEVSVTAMVESKLHDISYQWLTAQEETKGKFHQIKDLPASRRLICGARLAYSLKANNKGTKPQPSYFLQYSQEEYLPLLSRHSLWVNEGGRTKQEWWICYCRHRIGLVRTNAVHVMDFKDFSDWTRTRVTGGKLVEALIEPIHRLSCCQKQIRTKVSSKVCDWSIFAEALQFGETFASTFIEKESNVSYKEEKINFYFEKYEKYCSTSTKPRFFHRDVIRALLLSEHYDLVTELITDCCFHTLSREVGERWKELAHALIGRLDGYKKKHASVNKVSKDNEKPWKPAYDFLTYWRERFGENHKGALLGLYQAVQNILEHSNTTLQRLTECVIIVRSLDTLCQFDTRL